MISATSATWFSKMPSVLGFVNMMPAVSSSMMARIASGVTTPSAESSTGTGV